MTDPTTDPHGVEPDEATRQLDEEPSVDGLLDQISQMLGSQGGSDDGWNGIDGAGAALKKQREDQAAAVKKEANVFRDTFATEQGRRCLDILRERTIHARPYPSEAMLPLDAITALVIAHDAQCQFVWSILEAIAQADNLEAKPRNFQP